MFEYFEPEIKGGLFVFTETLCSGYLNRGTYAYYTYTTSWTQDLNMIKITAEGKDIGYMFDENGKLKHLQKFNNGKGDLYFSLYGIPALRAKNRHLKYLRIYLGKDKLVNQKNMIVIYRDNGWWSNKMEISDLPVTKQGKPNFGNRRFVSWTEWTLEKEKLANDYNALCLEYENRKKEICSKLFKEGR
jgi:hypothetical protein